MPFMQEFCNLAEKTPSQIIEESIQDIKAGKLPIKRNSMNYLTRFNAWLNKEENDFAPGSKRLAISVIKSFFKAFDIEISSSFGRAKKTLPLREHQYFLTYEDMKKLIVNAKNLRDKAIILCMATSGMAQAEILNLKIKDITVDENRIGVLKIRREKSQTDYTTFISPEAVDVLYDYFDERDRKVFLTSIP